MNKVELVLGEIKMSKKGIKSTKIGDILVIRKKPYIKINDFIKEDCSINDVYINNNDFICFKRDKK